jgi:3',5'-cyclic AMP phosphodiesterase CpdA
VTFLLAHLSDPHIGPLPQPRRRELFGKRVTGYLNWKQGRSRVHDMATLGHIIADVKALQPDHIAVTGDIANIGLPAEFQLARHWLETLGAPEDVSFVPGNHDAYVRGSLPDLARVFAPWTSGEPEAGEARTGGRFPFLRIRGKVAMIGLSSGVPTPFFIASGRLGRRQLAATESLLLECGRRGLVRIVMLHHPPRSAASSVGRGLSDARDFEDVIRRAGAELILHGHNHRQSVSYIEGPVRPAPVVGAPSASAIRASAHNRAGYHLFEVTGNGRDYSIKAHARGLLPGSTTIGDLGPIPL